MKAAWYDRYGDADVVEIRDVALPEISDNQVLVKVMSSSVTTADWRLRASAFPGAFWLPGRLMFGLFAPRAHVLGGDFAGRVVAVGKAVTRFAAGDAVFGFSTLGAHAEYLAIGADAAVVLMPSGMAFEQAAAVPFGGLAALVFLRDFSGLKPGQKVLVNGASGGVGVFAVQLAKAMGAEVTGVSSADNLALLRDLGADHVIDYAAGDTRGDSARYDVILDTIGTMDFAAAKPRLTSKGVFVPLNFGLREVWQSLLTRWRARRVVVGVSGDSQGDLTKLRDLLDTGQIRPVIGGRYRLEQIADAHRRVESRHKTGAISLMVAPPESEMVAAE